MGSTRLRITRRGRAVLAALIIVPLIAMALAFALNGGAATASAGPSTTDFQYVTVEPGQSLWQLAESIAPGADPRDVISDLVRLNGLQDSVVHPGERLAIPAAYAG
ncbi:MAG TPA: LysM peptidoglycan-binding domain-containing protein [Terrimesophilobacter sp.]|nr:LysM peptidoglycan-binding domain-containing protein [Terrimesophilobacter sp.]